MRFNSTKYPFFLTREVKKLEFILNIIRLMIHDSVIMSQLTRNSDLKLTKNESSQLISTIFNYF